MSTAGRSVRATDVVIGIATLVVALTLTGGLLVGGWQVVTRADPTVVAAITGAGATIFGATLTIVGGRIFERKKAIEAEQRAKWASMYEDFIRDWLKLMGLDKPQDERTGEISPREAVEFFAHFSSKAIPWASERVVDKWSRLRELSTNSSGEGRQRGLVLLLEFEKLLLEMRRDLGHKDKTLDNHQLLRMWINDLDQAIQRSQQSDRASVADSGQALE